MFTSPVQYFAITIAYRLELIEGANTGCHNAEGIDVDKQHDGPSPNINNVIYSLWIISATSPGFAFRRAA
jgi:hypothetical protein